mgnify:CR=1 FL=1
MDKYGRANDFPAISVVINTRILPVKFKHIFIVFILLIILLPVLFPGDGINRSSLLAAILFIVIALVATGIAFYIMRSKSPRTIAQDMSLARRILDEAESGIRPWLGDVDPNSLSNEQLGQYLDHVDEFYRALGNDDYLHEYEYGDN